MESRCGALSPPYSMSLIRAERLTLSLPFQMNSKIILFLLTICDFPFAIPSRESFGAHAEVQRATTKTLAIFTRRTTARVKCS